MQDLFFQKQKTEKEKLAEEKAAANENKKKVSRAEAKKQYLRAGRKDKFGNEIEYDSQEERSDE